MAERRLQNRLLCADLLKVVWTDRTGQLRRIVANLEDISLTGACIQVEQPVPLGTTVQIEHAEGQLGGQIRYCIYREIGYFLGIEFDESSRWSLGVYRPQHLFDPKRLFPPDQGTSEP
jgi:hypothetical protein